MDIRHDRIRRVQQRMREESIAALMIMNHDDFRFLFGTDRSQPRAIIPAEGAPVLVEGRLQQSNWETEAGEKRSRLEVNSKRIVLLWEREQEDAGDAEP